MVSHKTQMGIPNGKFWRHFAYTSGYNGLVVDVTGSVFTPSTANKLE